jgi:hypothetical protein
MLKNAGNIIKYYIPHHAIAPDHALNFHHCDNYKSQIYLLSYLWSQLGRLIFLNNCHSITDINVKSSPGITKQHLIKAYERVEVWHKISLTSVLDGDKSSVHAFATLS